MALLKKEWGKKFLQTKTGDQKDPNIQQMFIEYLQMMEGNTKDILGECGQKLPLSRTKCL